MKALLILLGLTALATTPVAPTGCSTTGVSVSDSRYGTVSYTLPTSKRSTSLPTSYAK